MDRHMQTKLHSYTPATVMLSQFTTCTLYILGVITNVTTKSHVVYTVKQVMFYFVENVLCLNLMKTIRIGVSVAATVNS